jgi:hypothetical protein
VIGADGAWAALAPSSLCDRHHEKAVFGAQPRKKNRAFPTAPGLAGISSEVIQSHWTRALLRKENKNVSFS